MIISLIAAIGKNNELGKGNDLLWKLPTDQKFFRDTTKGHTVIMGRKTLESMPGVLPYRRNIVITRDMNYAMKEVEVAHSLEEALSLLPNNNEETFIIGGAEIYKQSMDLADRLYITHIEAEDSEATAFFPEIIPVVWNEVSHQEYQATEKDPLPFTISVYEKI